jgi:hypothetical protein
MMWQYERRATADETQRAPLYWYLLLYRKEYGLLLALISVTERFFIKIEILPKLLVSWHVIFAI